MREGEELKTWKVRDWLSTECCGEDGAIEVLTECDGEDVEDGDRIRCTRHGIEGTVLEYCGGWDVEWDVEWDFDADDGRDFMKLDPALDIARRVMGELAPHCERIEIAGSIRRRKPEVGDIEIVAIPKPYEVDLFASGIALVVNRWPKVRGELPCKYTQRMLPDGIALDLFFATPENWGLIYAIRTGSADYSHRVLACGWSRRGYKSVGGMLTRDGVEVPVREERDLFRLAGVEWVEPEARNVPAW